jgi:hypothetical protein
VQIAKKMGHLGTKTKTWQVDARSASIFLAACLLGKIKMGIAKSVNCKKKNLGIGLIGE